MRSFPGQVGELPGLPMFVLRAKCFQIVPDHHAGIAPAGIALAVRRFGSRQQLLFGRPAIVIERPVAVRSVYVIARKTFLWFDMDDLVALAIMQLAEHLGQNMASTGRKKRLIWPFPGQKRVLPFFRRTIEQKTGPIHGPILSGNAKFAYIQ